MVGSATADKRKRVFKIYSPEEIQATEEATATRSLQKQKEIWLPKTPPKEQKPKSMSMSMTLSPARAPVPVVQCPNEYVDGNIYGYKAGDEVSVPNGDGTSIIYKCRGYPGFTLCNGDRYSPTNTETLCNGKECWPQAWTKVGTFICEEEFSYMIVSDGMDEYEYSYMDEYDYYDDYDPQEEVDYMAYLSLTVRGKLNKLSAYCPHGHGQGGLKVANAATVDKIETAADVNNDQVLSLTEYQGLPQIVFEYCNTKEAVTVAATKESSGDAKSGKGAGGRKRERVRGNMKY